MHRARACFPFLVAILISLPAYAQSGVAVIGYHEVDPQPSSGWGVSTADFLDQMRYLAVTGYHVIPVDALYEYVAKKPVRMPSHPVVITVDDGFLCAQTQIEPVLQKFGFPWSLYVYPAIIGVGSHALTWPDVVALESRGVEIGDHSMTHAHLMHRSHAEMSDAEYAEWLHDQLAGSKSVIESHIARPVRFVAYPYGDYDATVEAEALRDGYLLGLTSWVGINTPATDPMQIHRLAVISDTTLDQLRTALGAKSIGLEGVTPQNDSVLPDTGVTIEGVIGDHARFAPSAVHIAVLSGEPVSGHYDPASGRISLALTRAPESGREHVVVWGDDASGQRYADVLTYYASAAEKARYEAEQKKLLDLPLHHTEKSRSRK